MSSAGPSILTLSCRRLSGPLAGAGSEYLPRKASALLLHGGPPFWVETKKADLEGVGFRPDGRPPGGKLYAGVKSRTLTFFRDARRPGKNGSP